MIKTNIRGMRKNQLCFLIFMLLAGSITLGFSLAESAEKTSNVQLEEKEREVTSDDSFDKMMTVLSHKRCINCHPSGDQPRQGEDSHIHNFRVQRGTDGHGVAALQCSTCHQEANNDQSGVPGAPHWHLAPKSMAWEGLNRVEIAQAMLDPTKNGGRSLEQIVKHLTEDPLVLWVFEPGVNHEGIPREKPPLSRNEYIQAVKDWATGGAVIPEK